ncbi:MAG: hypothetical protein PF795_10705 [Kiritimatiellae bacterium]|jgi:hypothetical protein|nr:hypothetical protein [Kiritimatiellia bacterium]
MRVAVRERRLLLIGKRQREDHARLGVSPATIPFVPEDLDPETAAFLRSVAAEVIASN